MLRSSSMSGQCIPNPAPLMRQRNRCSSVASRSRGYQVKGTMIVRPSARSTASVSSVKWTSRTRSPELRWEAFIPFLQEESAVLKNHPMDSPELRRTKAEVTGKRNGLQPEFSGLVVAIHVDVWRFIWLVAVKVHSIRPCHQDGWHSLQYPISGSLWKRHTAALAFVLLSRHLIATLAQALWRKDGAAGNKNARAFALNYRRMLLISFVLFCIMPLWGQDRIITTIAGSIWTFNGDNKPIAEAALGSDGGVVVDSRDNVYLSDPANCMVHRLDPQGILTVIAGNGICESGNYQNVPARSTPFYRGPVMPLLAVDRYRNIYFAALNSILKVNPGGFLSRIAGGGNVDGPDGALATAVALSSPNVSAVDSQGSVYFREANRIRRVRGDNGRLETVAGNGGVGSAGDGGTPLGATLDMGNCGQLAIDSQGNLYICEMQGRRVRKVDFRTNRISTFAGAAEATWEYNTSRGDGGPATQAAIWPSALAIDKNDNIFIADGGRIRRIGPDGRISAFAGTDNSFGDATALAVDSRGTSYVRSRSMFWKAPLNVPATILNDGASFQNSGRGGPAIFADLNTPGALAYDRRSGSLYIADSRIGTIWRLDQEKRLQPAYQQGDVTGLTFDRDNRLYVTSFCSILRQENGVLVPFPVYPATFCPRVLATGPDGTLYAASWHAVWRISNDGASVRIAGNDTPGFSGDGGPATDARLNRPSGLAVDTTGAVYIADNNNLRIRRVDANGRISTFAGGGSSFRGDGGPATSARLSGPLGLAFDTGGNLYIADSIYPLVRVVSPTGIISTFAGSGIDAGFYGLGGDAGSATLATFRQPFGIAIDTEDNVLVSDLGTRSVRAILASKPAFDLVRDRSVYLLNFSAIQGSVQPVAGTFQVKASGAGLPYSVETESVVPGWLQVQTVVGTTGGPASVSFTVNPAGLAAKTYEGHIVVKVPAAVPQQRRVRIVLAVLPNADLSVSAGPTQALAQRAPVGAPLSFSFLVANNGSTNADNVSVSGMLPTGVRFVSCAFQGGQCSEDNGKFIAKRDDLTGNTSVPLVVTGTLTSELTQVSLQANVTADTSDTNTSNNSAMAVSDFGATTNCGGFSMLPANTTIGSAGGTIPVSVTAALPLCAWTVSGATSWITVDRTGGTGSGTIHFTVAANAGAARSATFSVGGTTYNLSQTAGSPGALPPTRFVSIPPCRVMETRAEYNFEGRTGAFGPPFVSPNQLRTLSLPASTVCRNIPASAKAFVLNVALIPRGPVNSVTVFPAGAMLPFFYTVRSPDGLIVANSAIVGAGPGGSITVYSTDPTDMVIDISGYFTDDPSVSNLVYYPLTPCRVIDTRAAYRQPAGPYAAPPLAARQTRDFRLPGNPYCSIPPGASAYSVTITAAPPGPLAFLSAWPQGTAQPNVSTLNSPNGRVLANSVILPASESGGISVFGYDSTDMIVDINGYFAPDDGINGLYFYPRAQCRIVESTNARWSSPFGGPIFENETRRTIPILQSTCPVPASVRAYALNATVEPDGSPMPFLTVWPTGQTQPNASVINAFEGQTVSSGFLVPAGTNGSVDIFAYRRTHVMLDIAGYFGR